MVVIASCFDPLYEPGPGEAWTVCCRHGQIDTCSCVDEQHCSFALTACASNTCVESGSCLGGGTGGGNGGTGGGAIGRDGGSSAGGAGGLGGQDAGGISDAGLAGMDAGQLADAGQAVDAGTDAGQTLPDAGPGITGYQPCCVQGHVGSCPCFGTCQTQFFRSCAMGRCVASSAGCP